LGIPKTHCQKLHHVPDAELSELLPVTKNLSVPVLVVEYNILQNNAILGGRVWRANHLVVWGIFQNRIPRRGWGLSGRRRLLIWIG
ncbi:unnamed protein product, partial [Tuber aestivum]